MRSKFNLSKAPKAVKESTEGRLKVMAGGDRDNPELFIMDYIGEDGFGGGVAAVDVSAFLRDNADREVTARWNSFGGDAYQGLVMFNAFMDHGNVTSVIEGIAFSAASIAVSGSANIKMQEQSDFGIHRSWTIALGNRNSMIAAQEWLDAVDEHQIGIFSNRTGESREQVVEWLDGTDDGTLFSAKAALEAGFIDEVIPMTERREKAAARVQDSVVKAAHGRIAAEIKQRRINASK